MIEFAQKLDNTLIEVIEGFCSHLQKQLGIPFGWMLTSISLGTATIGATAALLMFGDDGGYARYVMTAMWAVAFALIIAFFRQTLWHHMRHWPRSAMHQHWTRMALVTRESARPMRYAAVFGTCLFLPGIILQAAAGNEDLALSLLRFLFVSMVPITIMMYAFCAMPSASDKE